MKTDNLAPMLLVCDFDSSKSSEFNHFGSPIPLELEIGGSKGDSGNGIFIKENNPRVFSWHCVWYS